MEKNLQTTDDLINAFEAYNKVLFNFIYFQLRRRKDLAEDLTQEVFLKAWSKKDQFNEKKGSLKNWLFGIARNLIIDYFRVDRAVNAEDDFFDAQSGDDTNGETDTLNYFLHKGLAHLDKSDREMVVLRYIEGLEIEEIAEIFDTNYNNMKVKIHRAFAKLKEIILSSSSNNI